MGEVTDTEQRIEDRLDAIRKKLNEEDRKAMKSFLESAFFVSILLFAALGAVTTFTFFADMELPNPWREQLVFIAMKQEPGQKEKGTFAKELDEILVFRSLKTGKKYCYSNDGWKAYPSGEYVESKSMTWDLNRREDEGRNYRQLEYPDFVGQWKPEELRKIVEGVSP